jgi:hypothetical protein
MASLATRVVLLPEVIDLSLILTGSGLGGLIGSTYAALRRLPPARLGQVVVLGNLVGGFLAGILLLTGVLGLLS